MRIFVEGMLDESLQELRSFIVELGHEVVSKYTHSLSKDRLDAAIIYIIPFTENSQGVLLGHYNSVLEKLEKILPPNRICIVSDRLILVNKNHLIVGRWPRIRPKIYRWIDSISDNEEFKMNSQTTTNITTLENALSSVVNSNIKYNNVRVFSFSSKEGAKILNSYENLKIENATILLRAFTMVDKFLQLSVEETINESVELWNRMSKSGKVENLQIIRFDFHPTYDIYIFDDRYAIWRNLYYDFKNGEYFYDDEVLLIDSSYEFGKHFINKNIISFDRLVDNYSDL